MHKIIINLRVAAYKQPNVVGERFSADDSTKIQNSRNQKNMLLKNWFNWRETNWANNWRNIKKRGDGQKSLGK